MVIRGPKKPLPGGRRINWKWTPRKLVGIMEMFSALIGCWYAYVWQNSSIVHLRAVHFLLNENYIPIKEENAEINPKKPSQYCLPFSAISLAWALLTGLGLRTRHSAASHLQPLTTLPIPHSASGPAFSVSCGREQGALGLEPKDPCLNLSSISLCRLVEPHHFLESPFIIWKLESQCFLQRMVGNMKMG